MSATRPIAACFLLLMSGACAPLAEMRPAAGTMPGRTYEMGAAAVRLSPRPYVDESASGTGQLWFSADASKHFTFTAISAFDTGALALGVAARFNALRGRRLALAAETQLGYAWGAFTVPVALRLVDETWIYASPRFGTLGREFSLGVPVGVSVRIVEGFAIRGEAQLSWTTENASVVDGFKYYNQRLHLALGVAYQW